MGDALHLLPALTDLQSRFPQARVDWMIEDSFIEIPLWHTSVERVIPVSTRRWRSLTMQNIKEFFSFLKLLRARPYDVVIDAQGLMKSALLARFARIKRGGNRVGFGADSIKEKPAARFYNTRIDIPKEQHAIDRLRQLFAEGLNYPLSSSKPEYAIKLKSNDQPEIDSNSIMFVSQHHLEEQTSNRSMLA